MKKLVKKILLMISLIILGYTPVVIYNLAIDPYSIFRDDYSEQFIEPNQRFVKMKLLLNDEIDKKSFVFGSSRVGYILPHSNNLIDEYYNMSYSEGLPKEHLEDITLLLENDIKIKNIIIGLDNISYLVDPSYHENQAPRLSYDPDFPFKYIKYFKYLALTPSLRIYLQTRKGNAVNYDLANSGSTQLYEYDNWIEENESIHIKKHIFSIPTYENYYSQRISSTIEEIEQIVSICKENNILLKIFINPMHQTTYKRLNHDDFFSFLQQLALITDFYNFSGINEITTNNYNYYETSHYRPNIGNYIVDELFNRNSKSIVTKNNVDFVISQLKNEF